MGGRTADGILQRHVQSCPAGSKSRPQSVKHRTPGCRACDTGSSSPTRYLSAPWLAAPSMRATLPAARCAHTSEYLFLLPHCRAESAESAVPSFSFSNHPPFSCQCPCQCSLLWDQLPHTQCTTESGGTVGCVFQTLGAVYNADGCCWRGTGEGLFQEKITGMRALGKTE